MNTHKRLLLLFQPYQLLFFVTLIKRIFNKTLNFMTTSLFIRYTCYLINRKTDKKHLRK